MREAPAGAVLEVRAAAHHPGLHDLATVVQELDEDALAGGSKAGTAGGCVHLSCSTGARTTPGREQRGGG